MIRYQIRNEYGLSDPELYAPGEKDDPEALLEGVAMAGLVGVLRQLGDLAEFAAEIFHDLHEDVMATASRGHGLMLRLQQLEAEFPAVEKAIISQTDHSNYPHDDGVEWHAHLQLNQNMITQGDMPRFILDSYEECRGPPHLFTLDKFDVAGAGASLKRYSDPSFFKTVHATDMTEMNAVIEKKPRKIKKKALRWRKGETLESLLVANSESHTTSKDRNSRKVPPRTTKLKYRYRRDSDHISRMYREHLQEVISSQQKILSNYSSRHCHAKFRSVDSSEMSSSFGEFDNSSAHAQSSAKLELTKVVPINEYEYDTMETASTPINGSACLEAGVGQLQLTQHGPDKVDDVCKKSLVEQNAIFSISDKLQEDQDIVVDGSNCVLQSVQEENLLLPAGCADQDVDRCRPDDTGSDQENFVDALNNMEPEGEVDIDMKTKRDLLAKMELDELNFHHKECEIELHTEFPERDYAIDSSPWLNDARSGGEPICVESFLPSDSHPVVSTTKHSDTKSESSNIKLSGVDCINDEETFNDVDLMDVSSSSSVHSDDNGNMNGFEQYQEAFLSNDYHATVAHSSDEQSPQKSSGLDGSSLDNNYCIDKKYCPVEDGQNFAPDATSRILGKPIDVKQNNKEIDVGNADNSWLHCAISNQEVQKSNKQFEDLSLHTNTSPEKDAFLHPVMCTKDLELDEVAAPEKIVVNTALTGLGTDYIHEHVDELDSGVVPTNSSMKNNPLYESQDDEIVEELHSLPEEDLYKHVVEDDLIIVVAKGPFSTRANAHQEDPMQGSVVPRVFCNVQDLPGLTGTVSCPLEDEEDHADEILVLSSCELNDEKKPSLVDVPLTCSNASLLDNSSSCLEHNETTEKGKTVKSNGIMVNVEVAEESTSGRFADDMAPFEEDSVDGTKYSEKTEFVATNPREENSRHDVQLQYSPPCREELETVESHCKSLGSLDESKEHSFKKSVSQTDDLPQHIEIEKSGEACSNIDDIQYFSVSHSPKNPVCQDELQEETNLGAEVSYQCDLEKDGAITLNNSNMAGEQPANIDQDLAREPSAQDSFSTNPFMNPGYKTSHTLTDPCPSMSYQPCFSEEEQDFISELLIQHGDVGTAEDLNSGVDSLWEPATPPDEVPLASEVMTEEDFRSFCHEYHEMDFRAAPEELTGLDQGETYVCSKLDSKLDECSSAGDASGVPSVPMELEVVQHALPGVDSHGGGSQSLENDKINDTCSSPPGNIIPVKEKQETCANLVSHAFIINKKMDELDIPQSNSVLVEQVEEVRDLHEYNRSDVSWSSTNEKRDEVNAHLLSKPVKTQGSDALVLGELDSQVVPSSSVNEMIDYLDVPALSTVLEAKQDPEDCMLGEHNSQISKFSLIDEEKDELDVASPLSNALLVDMEQKVCDPVNSKTDESDAGTLTHVLPVEIELEVYSFPELISQITSCSLNDDKVCELDGPPCKQLESEKGSFCSAEIDCQVAPCLSNSVVLGETLTLSSTNAMSSTEEIYQMSPVPPPSEPLPNVSYEDHQKPPPLPPLQWRLGKPRLEIVSTEGHMPEFVRRTSPMHASNLEMGKMPGSLNGMTESIEPMSSQEIKERHQDSMLDNNDQGVEFRRLSTPSTLTEVTRTEYVQLLSEACVNIKNQECVPSLEIEAEEHQNDTGIVDGVNLHLTKPLFLVPAEHAINQQGPQESIFPSDTSVDDHNAVCAVDFYTTSSSEPVHVPENGCNQQHQHGELLSVSSVDKEHISDASYEEKNLKDHLITSEEHSCGTNCSAPDLLWEEGNIQNVENKCEGPLSSEESLGSVDYPHDDHDLEKEDTHQPDQYSARSGNNNYVSSPHEDDYYAHAEQPPVMGWTVGPQMLHPNYGISVEENQFEPKVADHRSTKKPISIRNIPRNPLVDAVAAHDRSTMRKVSERVPPTNNPKPNERNLLLEQIRNKTFNLKPVGSAKPTTVRAPARTSTRNLKVAAIIEKANAIRQAVGSDDEDGDNWSDA
ncbi:hypothetical protein GUJ93_ZPchr0003g17025 [Zizania palustris]|uniref:WH2 domain-containing protein n=1 Tax=Zizania palustris TaxID=103762 RepID=A0A8J5VD52_ZIZPA|nr:hypothetical protein GUJ93_ZPchr0003g17025 [Zizania palustris]